MLRGGEKGFVVRIDGLETVIARARKMKSVGRTKEQARWECPVIAPDPRESVRSERLPAKGVTRTVSLELIHDVPEIVGPDPALPERAMQRGGKLGFRVRRSGDIVCCAEFSHGFPSVILEIETDEIAGIAENHAAESALTSPSISSIDRLSRSGRSTPRAISFWKPGRTLRLAK